LPGGNGRNKTCTVILIKVPLEGANVV
jgi:hypothetical protein